MKINPACWFEMPVTSLAKAQNFYGAVFNFQFSLIESEGYKMAMFPMEMDGFGAGGALVEGPGYKPSHDGTQIYFSVKDITSTLNQIEKNGGKILKEKTDIGPYGFIGLFEDTEGNRVGLHSKPIGADC